MMEPDTKVAIRKFQRARKLRKIFQIQQEQMQQEREAQMQQQISELETETADKQMQSQLQGIEMKNQAGMAKTLATGRVKLNDTKLKGMFDTINKPSPTTPTKKG
jgi:hypothetical protein